MKKSESHAEDAFEGTKPSEKLAKGLASVPSMRPVNQRYSSPIK